MVLLARVFRRGHDDGSLDALCVVALLTRVASSVGVRLDMESKWRGDALVERLRVCWWRERTRGRKDAMVGDGGTTTEIDWR